jgi:hypothetical protein
LLVSSTFSFKDLLFGFLSLTMKVRLLEWYLMLQSRKLADNSTVRCSWIHGKPQNTIDICAKLANLKPEFAPKNRAATTNEQSSKAHRDHASSLNMQWSRQSLIATLIRTRTCKSTSSSSSETLEPGL